MKKIVIFIVVLFTAMSVSAQTPLPNDPKVKVGKLENGLTYYIMHNDYPENRAEFWLATNVGAIQETPDQDGLAHFLEHMCFNGTKNFPGKNILNYLQSIGAEFGSNINASTGIEQTQYMLNNIPLVRPGVVDTCIMIMRDYAHYVTNDIKEIDSERGVILEEKRTRNTADWRMYRKSAQYLYKGTKYADCSLIGSEENLKTFKKESLVNFYETWYHPDMQAFIVVGDVDVDEVEAKIKSIFGVIPAAVNPKAKDMHPIPNNEEPIVGIVTDPEATSTAVTVLWKSQPAPLEMNATDAGMVMTLVKSIISRVMTERFTDITSKPGAPFMGANLSLGRLVETCDAVYGQVAASKDGEAIKAFKAFYYEALKMQKYGFAEDEVNRAKDNILKLYEKAVEGADTRKNSELVSPLMENFYHKYPYMDPTTELSVAKAILSQLNSAIINQITAQIITDDNLVIVYQAPEKEGLTHPEESEFLAAIEEVKASEIVANKLENLDIPLIDPNTLKGSPVKKTKEVVHGSTEWTLKNGLKVVVHPTEYKKDQVIINLEKQGGSSLISNEELPSFDDNIFGLFLMNSGVAEFPSSTLSKMLAGKTVGVSPYIQGLKHGIEASSTPKDVETALQLMYLYFNSPRFDKDEYQVGVDQIKAVLPNIINQPSTVLQKEINTTLYGDSPRVMMISEEVLAKASLETIETVYRRLFNDVAGSVVYITGNVDLETLKPLVEKYLGSLAKGKKASKWIDNKTEIVKGEVINHFEVEMAAPKTTVVMLYSAYEPHSIERSVALSAAKSVLDMVYTKTIREEEGGTYGVGVSASSSKYPKDRQILQMSFDTNPESAKKLIAKAKEGLNDIIENGPSTEYYENTLKNIKKNIPEQKITNGYWMSMLNYYYNYNYKGTDYQKVYEAAVEALTPEKVVEALKELVSTGNYVEVVMSPKAKAE